MLSKYKINLEKSIAFPYNKITIITEVFPLEKSIKIKSYRNTVCQSC